MGEKLEITSKTYLSISNAFSSIMQNMTEGAKAAESAMNSQGSAMREQEQYMSSIKAKVNELKETAVGFWNTLISSEAIKGLVSMGTGAIRILDSLTKTFGGMPTVITAVSMAFLMFNENFRKLLGATDNAGKAFVPFIKNIIKAKQEGLGLEGLVFTFKKIDAEGKVLSTNLSLFGHIIDLTKYKVIALQAVVSLGLSLAISGLVTGITKLISSTKEAEKEFSKAISEMPSKSQELMNQQAMLKTLDELTAKKNKTKEEDSKLLEVQREFAKTFPELIDGFDSEGNAIVTNTKLVKEQIDEKRKLLKLENEALANEAKEKLPELEKKVKDEEKKFQDIQKRITELQKTSKGRYDKMSMDSLTNARDKSIKKYKEEIQEVNKLKGAMNTLSQINQKEIGDIIKRNKAFQDGKMSATQLTEELKKQGYNEKDIAKAIEEHTKATDKNSSAKRDNTKAIDENNSSLEKSTDAFKSASGEIKFLNEVMEDYNENGNLSAEHIATMADKYPQYLKCLEDENGFIDDITKARDNAMQKQQEQYDNLVESVENGKEAEIDAANESADARIEAGARAVDTNSENYNTDSDNFADNESNKQNNASDTEAEVTESTANTTDTNADNYEVDGSNFADNESNKQDDASDAAESVTGSYEGIIDPNASSYESDAQNFSDAQEEKESRAESAVNTIVSFFQWLADEITSLFNQAVEQYNEFVDIQSAMSSGSDSGGEDFDPHDVDGESESKPKTHKNKSSGKKVGVRNGGSKKSSGGGSGKRSGGGSGKKSSGGGSGRSGSNSGSGSSSGSKEKDVENLELEYDRYQKINAELEQYDYWIDKINSDKENAKTNKEKIKLLTDEVEWLNKKQKKLEELRAEQASEEKGLAYDLTQNGFDIQWVEEMDGQWTVHINNVKDNLEKLRKEANSKSGKAKEDAIKRVKELEEEVSKYIDLTANKMSESNEAWRENAKAIADTKKEMEDLVKEKMKTYIEKQKELDYMKMEERHKKEAIDLEKSIYAITREQFISYQNSKVQAINEEIAKIKDKILVDEKNLNLQEALKFKLEELKMIQDEQFDSIKNYQEVFEKSYRERIDFLDREMQKMDEQHEAELKAEEDAENKAKEEEERKNRLKEIAEAQKEINELEKQLINLKKEKNIRTLKKDEDGNFQWDWTYNQQEYDKVQEDIDKKHEDISKKQKENAKWEQDLVKQKEKKKKEEEFKAQKDKLANEKKYLEDVLRIQQQKYDEQKKKLDEKQQAEKDLMDAHYKDIEALTEQWLNDLKQIYGENWSQMSIIVDEKVTTMEKRIKEMIDAINLANQAVAGLGSGEAGVSSSMIKIGGQVLTAEEKYLADNPDVKAALQSGSAAFSSGRQHWELWGKNEGRSWGETSVTPPIYSPWTQGGGLWNNNWAIGRSGSIQKPNLNKTTDNSTTIQIQTVELKNVKNAESLKNELIAISNRAKSKYS